MTDPPNDPTAPAVTDKQRAGTYRRDLQRLLALSFSAGELSKYAERWRVFTDRQGGSEAGARALVRALESRGKLGELVESLRAHKPLVEWPEPPPSTTVLQEPVPDGGDDELEAADLDDADTTSRESDPSYDDAAPGESSPAARMGEPLVDPYLDDASELDAPPTHRLRTWLPPIATGIAGVAVGAAAMYLLHPDRKSPATNAPSAIAKLAAEHMRSRVNAVADACQVPAEGDSARDILGAAFAECGVPEIRPRKLPDPQPAFAPSPRPTKRRPNPPAVRGRTTRSPAPRCFDGCRDAYRSCAQTTCGPEPTSASANAAWSRCLSPCVSQRTRCRSTCR